MSNIKFDKIEIAMGRNGFYYQSGVDIYEPDNQNYIELTGLTSRGYPAKGWFKLPKNKIQELINELEKFK